MHRRLLAPVTSLLAATIACAAATTTVTPEPTSRGESPSWRLPGGEDHCAGSTAARYRLWLDGDAVRLEPVDGAPALDYGEPPALVITDDIDGDAIEDAIVSLGACGAWGHCIHAILLGCGDGRVALASEPELYALDFSLERDASGEATLWELTRGATAASDDLGRVRWAIDAHRAYPTDDYELLQSRRAP